jgi:hypothetical protein
MRQLPLFIQLQKKPDDLYKIVIFPAQNTVFLLAMHSGKRCSSAYYAGPGGGLLPR